MTRRLLTSLIFLTFASSALAQESVSLAVPPENYAVTHFWSSPSIISLRHMAMGGAFAADDRSDWHGNPAGLVAIHEPTLYASTNQTAFDLLPEFRARFLGYAQPVGKQAQGALKLTYVTVRAGGTIASGPVPLLAEIKEEDYGIEYGRHLGRRTSIGIATAYLSTESDYGIAGLGRITSLKGRPSGFGGRLGIIYDLSGHVAVGALYDRYAEKIRRVAPALGVGEEAFLFRSSAYRIGVAFRPDADTTLLLDFDARHLRGNGTTITRQAWVAGIERAVGPARLRLGSFDGQSTGGIGVVLGQFEVSYAFTRRYDRDLPGAGAHTSHAFDVRARFR
jgi:hypothetical protein